MTKNRWEVIVEEDENGETIIPLPKDLIKKYNWLENDELDVDIQGDYIIITNVTAKIRDQGNKVD